jgi:hypothetical protein
MSDHCDDKSDCKCEKCKHIDTMQQEVHAIDVVNIPDISMRLKRYQKLHSDYRQMGLSCNTYTNNKLEILLESVMY